MLGKALKTMNGAVRKTQPTEGAILQSGEQADKLILQVSG